MGSLSAMVHVDAGGGPAAESRKVARRRGTIRSSTWEALAWGEVGLSGRHGCLSAFALEGNNVLPGLFFGRTMSFPRAFASATQSLSLLRYPRHTLREGGRRRHDHLSMHLVRQSLCSVQDDDVYLLYMHDRT